MAVIDQLIEIMARLRDREGGCPWDLEQDFGSIAPYTIEEAYEVADAIARNDMADLKDELGDLLFQVAFHAQLAREIGAFEFDDVVRAINEKMTRRHPHVFGDVDAKDAEAVLVNWNATKAEERKARGDHDPSALAGISRGMPEWIRATKLQSRAARTGFDWPDYKPVLAKLREEVSELEVEFEQRAQGVDTPELQQRLEEELGDVLFVVANVARHANVDVGKALRGANAKFEQRFRGMEADASDAGQRLEEMGLDNLTELWNAQKNKPVSG